MKYEEIPVHTFLRYGLCDCGGRLVGVEDAPMQMSMPPRFLHQCASCSQQQWLQEKSPALVTRSQS